MTRHFSPLAAGVACAILLLPAPLFAQSGAGAPGGRRARVDLLSSAEAVSPGEPLELGVRFKIADHWHIYWHNSGDSGMPPQLSWTLPDGFRVGEPTFPVPKRYSDAGGFITTNVLAGEPVLLVTLDTPADIADKEVTIAGKVQYLVCHETCLREEETVSLTLAVRSGDVARVNEDVFKAARAKLPKPSSKYVTLKASVTEGSLEPGKTFQLGVAVNVRKGFHIQSNKPTNEALFGCDLFVKKIPDVYWEETTFPTPKIRKDQAFGTLSEFAGVFTINVTGEVDGEATGPYPIGGVFVFQACDDKGHCFPPEAVDFAVPDSSARADVVGSVDAPTSDTSPPVETAPVAANTTPGEPAVDTAVKTGTVAPTTDSAAFNGVASTFLGLLGLAFLGGLILNVMPCVLPVISIKILGFVQQAGESRGRVFRLGLAFAAGMVISFWVLAGVIIALKTTGSKLGWGFQFQSPRFVIGMVALMFVFGLSLLGVFSITLPGATVTKLAAAEEREGYLGAFMKGVLGTVLATPCTAPFLGPALGVAFQSSHTELFLIFTAVGFGMSSPFVLLTAFPAWLKFIPRPGAWMESFKQVMGFLLLGTVLWLMNTLGAQIGVSGIVWTGSFLLCLGVACWILGQQTPSTPVGKRLLAWAAALGLTVFGWWGSFERDVTIEEHMAAVLASRVCPCDVDVPDIPRTAWDKKIPWQNWSKGRPEALAAQGYTVYVDYTATWCATCLANKKATLETEAVRLEMRDQCVIPVKADFTLEDPDILNDLTKFHRSGVPLNVIYPAGRPDEPIIMPEQLVGRGALVLDRLAEAGPSFSCSSVTTALPLDGK